MADYFKGEFTISTDPGLLDIDVIQRYLNEESYWAHDRSREIIERSIRCSFCFGVYTTKDGPPRQIGFARIVSDFATVAYMADVFILPDYQGQGLGKWLVETILNHPDLKTVRRWILYTSSAHDLYRRFGFETARDQDSYMSYYPSTDITDH